MMNNHPINTRNHRRDIGESILQRGSRRNGNEVERCTGM